MLAYKAKQNNANALMMKRDVHSRMTSLRIIVEISAVSLRQLSSSSARGTTGMCTPTPPPCGLYRLTGESNEDFLCLQNRDRRFQARQHGLGATIPY